MLLAVNGFEAFSSELAQAGELMGFEASHTKKSSRSIGTRGTGAKKLPFLSQMTKRSA